MKYCCDCAYMDEIANNNGLFKCENARKSNYPLVSARMQACNCFLGAFYSKRGEGAREKMMKVSRDHGYYIMTALTEVLGLSNILTDYFCLFKKMEEDKHPEFFLDYELNGPAIQAYLLSDPDRFKIASNLYIDYVSSFMAYVDVEDFESAFREYFKMYSYLYKQLEMNNNLNLSRK